MEASINEMEFQSSKSVDKFLKKMPAHFVFENTKCNARKLMHLHDSAV